jgi:hypothetical protein
MARTKKWSRSQIFRSTADKLAAVWAGIPPIPGPELTRLPRLVGDPNETPRTDPVCWLESVEHPVLVGPATELPGTGMVCALTPELPAIPPA